MRLNLSFCLKADGSAVTIRITPVIRQACMVVSMVVVYGSTLYDETLTRVQTTVYASHDRDEVHSLFRFISFLTGNECQLLSRVCIIETGTTLLEDDTNGSCYPHNKVGAVPTMFVRATSCVGECSHYSASLRSLVLSLTTWSLRPLSTMSPLSVGREFLSILLAVQ
uniref:Polyketide synthase n=1 Tax=Peronospora matthiolae TaxID=2874970 RepID=A0AAV1VF84_9STRA